MWVDHRRGAPPRAPLTRPRSRAAGFTLIELMIVLIVIGILATIAIPNYSRTRARADRASCVTNQRNLILASTLYINDQQILDAVISCSVLFDNGYATSDMTECPRSEADDHDDYEITIEGGHVVDTECQLYPDEHQLQ